MPKSPPDAYELPYRVGQKVAIGPSEKEMISAVVTGISIRDSVLYECAWIHDGKRETAWVTADEIIGNHQACQTIVGFVRNNDQKS